MFSSSICTSCFVSASFMGDYKHTHPGVDAAFVSVTTLAPPAGADIE